jgi:hypothetical protein
MLAQVRPGNVLPSLMADPRRRSGGWPSSTIIDLAPASDRPPGEVLPCYTSPLLPLTKPPRRLQPES